MRGRLLLVDDEPVVRFGIRHFLEEQGLEVWEAANCQQAREFLRQARPDVVLLDDGLPDGAALELLSEIHSLAPSLPVLMLTARNSVEFAVHAIKQGAEEVLIKPVELPPLKALIERLLEERRARLRELAQAAEEGGDFNPFLGVSLLIHSLEEMVKRVLGSNSPVLLLGETGTGKGVLARWMHDHGPRSGAPLVQLNCAGLSASLLESELFGYERGAFTGAVSRKLGLLEVAHQGTVFLDEMGDMDVQVQPRLLKVLEEKRFHRLGEVEDRSVDVRIIAATHHNLAERVRTQRFRGDLYFRISTLPLRLPALRERSEDIPLLARSILARLSQELGRPGLGLSPAAEAVLCAYRWPGNIRELRNVLERAVLLSHRPLLLPTDLHFDSLPGCQEDTPRTPEAELDLPLSEVERRHIQRVLAAEGGHVERAARRLGIPRSSLYQKLKALGLARPKSRLQNPAPGEGPEK
jgi:DNA-binding NtrC family response regulator